MALVAGVVLSAWAVPARGECIDAPDLAAYQTALPQDFAYGATRSDRLGRVVAPVSVNGQGPFRFIVDTGANRSVVSQALAEQLGLPLNGSGEVHSVHGVTVAPLVQVGSLEYGQLSLSTAAMPMLQGAVLAGEHGLLGVDGMRGRRLRMDFERKLH
jgi:predicted aspartyl protease